jgi:uncharacterized coiled-coil protein SlyX
MTVDNAPINLQKRIAELEETIKQQEIDMQSVLDLAEPNTKMLFINQALMLALQLGLNYAQLNKGVQAYTGKNTLSDCGLEEVKLVVTKLVNKLESTQNTQTSAANSNATPEL